MNYNFSELRELFVKEVKVKDSRTIEVKSTSRDYRTDFLGQKSNSGEHANTAVLELSLAEPAKVDQA
jgi:hypothetical protein